MATKKVGDLIKEARTNAGLTQAELAKKAKCGLTATDISKAERGLTDLTDEQLRSIAKVCGVTQKSLVEAPKGATKKPATSSSTGKTSTSSSSTAKKSSMQVTATEKKLVEYYRAADSKTRSAAMKMLKGEEDSVTDILESLLGGSSKKSSKDSILLEALSSILDKK